MMTDNDVNELRRFRAALDEPADDAFPRVRRRLTATIEGPASPVPLEQAGPRRRATWLLAAAGAATAVAAVVAAAAIGLPTPEAGGTQVATPPTTPPVDALATAPAVEAWPADLAATMERLALLGGQLQPITVPAGKVLHNGSTIDQRDGNNATHEVWYDVNGVIALRIRRTGFGASDHSATEAEITASRQHFATEGPSFAQPSPAYLASLPTDPGRLLTQLLPPRSDKEGARAPEHYLLKECLQVFYYLQAVLQPETRQALYRMLGRMAGVRTLGALDIGGRPYVVVGRDERMRDDTVDTMVLLFDPATGRVVGDGSLIDGQLDYLARWTEPTIEDAPIPGTGDRTRTKPGATVSGGPGSGGAGTEKPGGANG